VVSICTTVLTYSNFVFCPRSVTMCFTWTAIPGAVNLIWNYGRWWATCFYAGCLFDLFLDSEDGSYIFLRNVCWIAMEYVAIYSRIMCDIGACISSTGRTNRHLKLYNRFLKKEFWGHVIYFAEFSRRTLLHGIRYCVGMWFRLADMWTGAALVNKIWTKYSRERRRKLDFVYEYIQIFWDCLRHGGDR
jgi:hypothetical protein